jgi:ADP-ribose pyrophosphatase YjhB (NUDIX family)
MECTHSLICDVAVVAGDSVLMVTYRDLDKYDGEGGWFLPDDVLHEFEHPTKAATRIAREQLGLELKDVHLEHIESFQGNDGGWHLSFHHLAKFPSAPAIEAAPVVARAEWFPLDDLPDRDEVAHHGWALSVLTKMKRLGVV